MDDRLNQAAACRRKRSLLFAIVTCIGAESHADQAWYAQEVVQPNSVAASSYNAQGTRAPQFIHEPEEVQTLPWATVAGAAIRSPIPPALAKIPSPPAVTTREVEADSAAELAPSKPSQRSTPAMLTATRKRRAEQVANAIDVASLQVIEDPSNDSLSTAYYNESQSSSAVVLPGVSIAALRQSAAVSLDEANSRLMHQASLSATAAATHSLKLIAQSLDLSQGNGRASQQLDAALTAIREADDFVGRYGLVDATAIARMVQSHETKTLKGFNTSQLTGIIAADVYLDSARQMLTGLAASDPLAAHALCLLAKSYRQRTADSPIALATSVHLMRAAVSAAPQDRGLAMEFASVLQQANMIDEARMQQAYIAQLPTNAADLSLQSEDVIAVVTGTTTGQNIGQPEQAVRIEQISPEAFAMVSKVEAGPTSPASAAAPRQAYETAPRQSAGSMEPQEPNKSEDNVVTRAFKNTMTRMWWR